MALYWNSDAAVTMYIWIAVCDLYAVNIWMRRGCYSTSTLKVYCCKTTSFIYKVKQSRLKYFHENQSNERLYIVSSKDYMLLQ